MSRADWEDQYRRVIRWRQRLQCLNPSEPGFNHYVLEDCFFAFFQNCFHLRDWLNVSVPLKDNVFDFVNNNPYLEICRGIANGTKHFKLDHEKYHYGSKYHRTYVGTPNNVLFASSTGGSQSMTFSEVPFAIKPGECFVTIENYKYEMFDLADKCITSWNTFLVNNGITPPSL